MAEQGLRKSRETNSSSLKADAWHHRSDAITSVVPAFAGISIALLFAKGYETADDWAPLAVSGFIFYNSYLILRPALERSWMSTFTMISKTRSAGRPFRWKA